MNKTFKEQYKEQQEIQSGLASFWGYCQATTSIDSKQKKHVENARPVVANITLRKFGKSIEKTQKIKQVEDEIRGIENERMLRELKESKYEQPTLEQKSDIINLMEKMIEDYNDIVQHKHIKPTSKNLKQVYASERKKGNQRLLDTIEEKKNLLVKADLNQQIKINKEIAQLYREYNYYDGNLSSISLANNRSMAPQAPISFKTMKKHQSETFEKLEELASLNNMNKFISLKMSNSDEKLREMVKIFRKKSDINGQPDAQIIKKFRELQLKKYQTMNKKQSFFHHTFAHPAHSPNRKTQKRIKGSLEKDMNQPFLEKKDVEEYRDLENKIKSNSDALELWKSKIFDASHNSRLQWQAERIKDLTKKKEFELQHREERIEHVIEKSINMMSVDQASSDSAAKQKQREHQQLHEIEKEKIFAELLRKRNNKFNKLWGTKILIKYDSHEEAKSMLKGESEHSPRKTKSSISHRRDNGNSSRLKSKTVDLSLQIPSSTLLQNKKGGRASSMSWQEQKNDEQHYWRMCKNQKINLLLKRR